MNKFWLALSKVSAVSTRLLLSLVEHLGSPEKVFLAQEADIASVPDIGTTRSNKVVEALRKIDPDHEAELLQKRQIRFICVDEPEYPENLREIYDPPLVLYVKGHLLPGDSQSVAVVGARKATGYGRTVAFTLSEDLVRHGVTVVSGLARGIDAYAHKGALDGGGRTVAVLGCGIDIAYPPENRSLQDRIEKNGAVLSEFPPGTAPMKHHFPARNRIIAGLSMGTVVVEAGLKSGALITAEFALNSGREVFAVPGNVMSELSRGPHRLIREGAKLVETANDVIKELKIAPVAEKPQALPMSLSYGEEQVLQLIPAEGKSVSEMVEESDMQPHMIMAQLSMMEIRGLVKKGPGNSYFRVIPSRKE